MAVVINGSGTVTGLAVGGLPDGIVDAGTLATNSVDSAELIDGAVDASHLAGGDNTPAFSAYLGGDQAIAHATYTTIAYNTELVDTDSCFSTSTYRFTPTTAGYYFVSSTIFFGGQVANTLFLNVIFKNSASDVVSRSVSHTAYVENTANTTSGVVYLNGSSDFVYAQIKHTADATKNAEANKTIFSGFKLAGV